MICPCYAVLGETDYKMVVSFNVWMDFLRCLSDQIEKLGFVVTSAMVAVIGHRRTCKLIVKSTFCCMQEKVILVAAV